MGFRKENGKFQKTILFQNSIEKKRFINIGRNFVF